MAHLVLAIDQGTTGTTALVLDETGVVRGRSYAEIRQYFPRPGWVEHDPEEIHGSAVATARQALRRARARPRDLRAVGIANQRETFLLWERGTGRPIGRAIVWQCRRSASICRELKSHEKRIAAITGLVLDPYFSGTKLKWVFDHDPKLRARAARGELCFGTIDSWLIFRLSGGSIHVTDFTNASRTMLFDLSRLQWSEPMLRLLGVPQEILPRIVSSRGPIAEIKAGIIGPDAAPIGSCIGDQQAALYGHGANIKGQAMVTYGTGAFVLTHTGDKRIRSRNRLPATVALDPCGEPGYAMEGSVFIAGAAIQWLRDGLKMIGSSAESFKLARMASDSSEVYLVPAFTGLGAPYWDSEARGAIFGITRATTRADVARAALEGIAYQVDDVLRAIEADTRSSLMELRVGGGAAANDYLMQFQADLTGRPVLRPAMVETTALGAAMLAGMAVGLWRTSAEVLAAHKPRTSFKPKINATRRRELRQGWQTAVGRVLSRRAK